MSYDPLIYGKQDLDRIVNIEIVDNIAYITRLKEDGTYDLVQRPNLFWVLSNEKHGKDWLRLEGDLHYKWGRQFKVKSEMMKAVNYLKDKDVYCVWNSTEAFMIKDGYGYFKGLKPKDIPILSFDIETTGLDPAKSNLLLISNTFRDYHGKIQKKLFSYDDYESEQQMIGHWCDWVREIDPVIITGHNIIQFDLNYMLYKTDLNLGTDGSKMKQSNRESIFRVDGSMDLHYKKIKIFGREIIDTLFLAYRYDIYTKKYESYGLKNIIHQEKLEKKDRTFYDASQIRFKYKDVKEWEKIKLYCNDDSDDGLTLFDLMSPSQFYLTQSIPKPFQMVHESATGSQLNSVLVRSYLQEKHSIPKATPSGKSFEGAISVGIPGAYKNCVRWDVASLYPSIILTYKIYDRDKDPKGYFLKMMQTFTTERLKNKKLAKETGNPYYKDLEQSGKIFINSGFGFMGASGLNFNSPPNAGLIMNYGRKILLKAVNHFTGLTEVDINLLLGKEDV